jgi:hypothetical protein
VIVISAIVPTVLAERYFSPAAGYGAGAGGRWGVDEELP